MVEILNNAEKIKKKHSGKPSKLCMEDRLLMTLEYLHKYRTDFYIVVSRKINESTVIRILKWI